MQELFRKFKALRDNAQTLKYDLLIFIWFFKQYLDFVLN